MRAELRSLSSPDVESLETWRPVDADFSVPLRLIVGRRGGDGEESFDLTVCTGGWLANVARETGIVDARHHVVVDGFNWSAIRSYLERRVADCAGETWDDIAERLSRFAYWEFEDYR
jgi:hypothetical protein